MDFFVELMDSDGVVIRDETFVGIASLAGMLLRLSHDWDLTDNIDSVHIHRIAEELNGRNS